MLNLQPKNFKIILWDMDGTLLDFYPAERYAITTTMAEFGLPSCTDNMVSRYSKINEQYWKRMELGEITKEQVLLGRFETFFQEEGVLAFTDYAGFNARYQENLGARVFFHDKAYEIAAALKGKVLQYAVTNGTTTAQTLKLKNSGLDKIFDDVFISDKIGAQKPSQGFCDYVKAHIPAVPREEILIIGDSLTSDMATGNKLGVKCCWFNPDHKPVPTDGSVQLDYIISSLIEIEKFI